MLKDDRVRALAIEFGTQWMHVRGFDEFKEKNEKLFPTFDANLRKAIYEESILFFQDLFQSDRAVSADSRRRLHVPQRNAGQTLRHSRRHRASSGGGSRACGSMAAAASWVWRACRPSSPERRGPVRSCAATGWWRRCSARSCRDRPPMSRDCPKKKAGPID